MTKNAWSLQEINYREPPFMVSSRRPGIGHAFASDLGAAMEHYEHSPPTFRHEGHVWPLDRYMRSKIEAANQKKTRSYLSPLRRALESGPFLSPSKKALILREEAQDEGDAAAPRVALVLERQKRKERL